MARIVRAILAVLVVLARSVVLPAASMPVPVLVSANQIHPQSGSIVMAEMTSSQKKKLLK